jgi:hypothetical protein
MDHRVNLQTVPVPGLTVGARSFPVAPGNPGDFKELSVQRQPLGLKGLKEFGMAAGKSTLSFLLSLPIPLTHCRLRILSRETMRKREEGRMEREGIGKEVMDMERK